MIPDDRKKYRKELLFASTIVATGLVMSALSLTALSTREPQHTSAHSSAQAHATAAVLAGHAGREQRAR